MSFLKKIFEFYVFSNLHVAVAGFCLVKISLLKFGQKESFVPLFVALSIVLSYNFIRFYELKTKRVIWLKEWFNKHKLTLLILSLAAFVGFFSIFFFTNFNQISVFCLMPFFVITFFYVIPIYRSRKFEFSFRNFPIIKIFSIAISWAGITVFFPLVEVEFKLNIDVYLEFFQRFLILIAITLPFDIRDLECDPKEMKTLPQIFGVKKSKSIGLLLLILFVLFEFLKEGGDLISTSLIAVIAGFFLKFTNEYQTRYYTAFWVESVPVFWLFLIILFL